MQGGLRLPLPYKIQYSLQLRKILENHMNNLKTKPTALNSGKMKNPGGVAQVSQKGVSHWCEEESCVRGVAASPSLQYIV